MIVTLEQATRSALRDRHPAWRLLASPDAPLVASFPHRVLVAPSERVVRTVDRAEVPIPRKAAPSTPLRLYGRRTFSVADEHRRRFAHGLRARLRSGRPARRRGGCALRSLARCQTKRWQQRRLRRRP